MSSTAFLLAIAAPTASLATSGLVATTQVVGHAFNNVLGAVVGKQAADNATATDETLADPTLSESLQSFAIKLRGWLGEQGVIDSYSISYHLEADGASNLDVSGAGAEQVKQLLAIKPNWLSELRQIAVSMQAQTAGLNGTGWANPARIDISDVDCRMS